MPPVATIKDVQEDNDDEKRQAYYAGGQGQNGGGSGQEVLDPREFMKRARDEMGAATLDEYQQNQPAAASSSFTGTGYSLNGASVAGASAPKPPTRHTITFYQDGFTVDDGPLRKANDPENAAFLAAVNRGQMPTELMGEDDEAEQDVDIIDKSGEAYKAPPVVLKPFSGEGRSMRDEGASSAAAPVVPIEAQELTVDTGQPTTTLQVRLADGNRKIVKANHTHTVLQLRMHIATLTPGIGFTLKGGYPPKLLDADDLTLADAKLLNETIVQSAA